MKTLSLCVLTFAALLVLQGCAVNVIVAPNATFVGGDFRSGDDVGEQNNGSQTALVMPEGVE